MNYHDIQKTSLVDGRGIRTVLWVAGCDHKCAGCQNPITWNPDDGLEFDDNAETELFTYLDKDYCDGLTLSGGDPLYVNNRAIITRLCKRFRYRYAYDKTIWMYTGYLWEEIKDLEVVGYIDVLVDGPYVEELRDVNYMWAGSTNQRVIDTRRSLETGKVVLYEE